MDLLVVMLAVGFGALLAQAVLTRELLAVCSGNELTISLMLGLWLASVAIGAVVGRRSAARLTGLRLPVGVTVGFVLLATWLPLAVVLIRAARRVIGVGAGEYLSLGGTAGLAAIVVFPVGLAVGGVLPLACEALARRGHSRVVSRLYTVEAVGSMLGGVLMTFVFAGNLSAWQIMSLGAAVLVYAAAITAQGRPRRMLGVVAGMTLAAGLCPTCWMGLDTRTAAWRLQGLRAQAAEPWRMVASVDTRYQNLQLVERAGQYTLYGDGQVLFSLPDPIAAEHTLHPIMAQHPAARRVLLLGGDPTADVPELLKYPVERIVHVELDPGIARLLRRVVPERVAAVLRDPRVRSIYEDGPLFVRRSREVFDLVIVRAPEPVSGAYNRFFTREFYEAVRARLAPGGVVWTSLEASERLGPDARRVAASVYRTLTAVFDTVRVTAGSPLQLIAGFRDSSLTGDRDTLYRRSAAARVPTRFYRPEYLLDADELDPAKVLAVERSLRSAAAPVNTLWRPVTYRQSLVLWSRFSGSGVDRALGVLDRMHPAILLAGACGLGVVLAWACPFLRRRKPVVAMVATGFGGVTLEVILLYLIQGMQGYLYVQYGLLVALFMGGSALGARAAGRLEAAPEAAARRVAMALLLVLAALAATLAAGGRVLMSMPHPTVWIGVMLALTGALVAAQFVAVAHLLRVRGMKAGGAAALTETADYGGSMLGGLLGGVVLVPVAGIGGACGILAVLCGLAWVALRMENRG
jgi:predicted membrane-bound spermidine synthase